MKIIREALAVRQGEAAKNHKRQITKNEKENNHMTKTKLEKIASIEEQILQLENQRKLLMQKQKEDDRKDEPNG